MTTAAPQKSNLALSPALKLAVALTLAACTWVAWQEYETPPAKAVRDGNASTRATRTNPGSMPSSRRPSDSAKTAWPEALNVAARSNWPAFSASGGAAWAASTTPASAPVAIKTKHAASRNQPVIASGEPAPAPAFPYVFIGRLEDGETQALLSGPNRSFGVKAGQVIDGQWRVDAVQAQSLLLTWLPGSVKKTVAFAAS